MAGTELHPTVSNNHWSFGKLPEKPETPVARVLALFEIIAQLVSQLGIPQSVQRQLLQLSNPLS